METASIAFAERPAVNEQAALRAATYTQEQARQAAAAVNHIGQELAAAVQRQREPLLRAAVAADRDALTDYWQAVEVLAAAGDAVNAAGTRIGIHTAAVAGVLDDPTIPAGATVAIPDLALPQPWQTARVVAQLDQLEAKLNPAPEVEHKDSHQQKRRTGARSLEDDL